MRSLPVIFFLRLLAPEKFVSCATKILKIVSDEAYPVETVADVSVIAAADAADMAKARDFDRPRHDTLCFGCDFCSTSWRKRSLFNQRRNDGSNFVNKCLAT